ncbi:MAG: hypothetical protein IPK00_25370 [Deltaproteobacteria bacterium]|nr:hypothetical protein [Deltaproteobacteria bacterium]
MSDASCIVLHAPTSGSSAPIPDRGRGLQADPQPWHLDYSARQPSGGSGAAVAAGMVPIAHSFRRRRVGAECRLPSAGWSGLKPTRGRFSAEPEHDEHWGGISTDGFSRGPSAIAAVFDAVAGPHASDPVRNPRAARFGDARVADATPRGSACRARAPAATIPPIRRRRDHARDCTPARGGGTRRRPGLAWGARGGEGGVWPSGGRSSPPVSRSRGSRRGRGASYREIALDAFSRPCNRMSVAGGRAVTGLNSSRRAGALRLVAPARRLVRRLRSAADARPDPARDPDRRAPARPDSGGLDAMRRRLGWLPGPWNVTGQPAINVPAGADAGGDCRSGSSSWRRGVRRICSCASPPGSRQPSP